MWFRKNALKWEYDRHHIIPRSRGGSDNEKNLVRLLRANHEDIHALFGNDLPHEQIETLLNTYNTALTKGFRKDLLEVLLANEDKYYIQEVRKSRK